MSLVVIEEIREKKFIKLDITKHIRLTVHSRNSHMLPEKQGGQELESVFHVPYKAGKEA